MNRTSWTHAGGDVGILLCHGFTASPLSMRPWGEALAAAGYTVSIPLLPGHGATWREVNETTWEEWYETLDTAYEELAAQCTTVLAMGLSMGGALTLHLAAQHPEIAGIVTVNPSLRSDWKALQALPVVTRAVPALPSRRSEIRSIGERGEPAWLPLRALQSLSELWPVVRSELTQITQPVLVFRSALDRVVSPASTQLVLAGARGPAWEVVLPHSGHMAVLDWDAPHLYAESIRFTETLLAGETFTPDPVPAIPEALQQQYRLAVARHAADQLGKRIAALELTQVQQRAARAQQTSVAALQQVRQRLGESAAQAALNRLRAARAAADQEAAEQH